MRLVLQGGGGEDDVPQRACRRVVLCHACYVCHIPIYRIILHCVISQYIVSYYIMLHPIILYYEERGEEVHAGRGAWNAIVCTVALGRKLS